MSLVYESPDGTVSVYKEEYRYNIKDLMKKKDGFRRRQVAFAFMFGATFGLTGYSKLISPYNCCDFSLVKNSRSLIASFLFLE